MNENSWIKVKEKLPESRVEVLVTTRYGYLALAYYDPKEGWHLAANDMLFVLSPVAWQPLPDPYKDI